MDGEMEKRSYKGPIWIMIVLSMLAFYLSFMFLVEDESFTEKEIIVVAAYLLLVAPCIFWISRIARYNNIAEQANKEIKKKQDEIMYFVTCWRCGFRFYYKKNYVLPHKRHPNGYIRCDKCGNVLEHSELNRCQN